MNPRRQKGFTLPELLFVLTLAALFFVLGLTGRPPEEPARPVRPTVVRNAPKTRTVARANMPARPSVVEP